MNVEEADKHDFSGAAYNNNIEEHDNDEDLIKLTYLIRGPSRGVQVKYMMTLRRTGSLRST